MAINKNHEFEDLDGLKCAIVERNASTDRAGFLRELLELNGFTVKIIPTAPPKATAVAPDQGAPAAMPSTYTVGVTDVAFNSVNAVFGRLLRTAQGHIVTPKYWQQKEAVSHDEIPYFESGTVTP